VDEPGVYAVVRKFADEPDPGRFADDEGTVPIGELVHWGVLEEGMFVMSCDSITDTACVVPNVVRLPWDQSRGTKKRDKTENKLQAAVDPIGGYLVVTPKSEWGDWFIDSVLNRI
jgi:hypothetical protein